MSFYLSRLSACMSLPSLLILVPIKFITGVCIMSDFFSDKDNHEQEESFASLLDSYNPTADTDFQVGDKLVGKIISIGKDTVFVDTNTKIDGVVEKKEL